MSSRAVFSAVGDNRSPVHGIPALSVATTIRFLGVLMRILYDDQVFVVLLRYASCNPCRKENTLTW